MRGVLPPSRPGPQRARKCFTREGLSTKINKPEQRYFCKMKNKYQTQRQSGRRAEPSFPGPESNCCALGPHRRFERNPINIPIPGSGGEPSAGAPPGCRGLTGMGTRMGRGCSPCPRRGPLLPVSQLPRGTAAPPRAVLRGRGGFQRLLPRGMLQNSRTLPRHRLPRRHRLRQRPSEDRTGHVPARSGARLGPASPRGHGGLSRSGGLPSTPHPRSRAQTVPVWLLRSPRLPRRQRGGRAPRSRVNHCRDRNQTALTGSVSRPASPSVGRAKGRGPGASALLAPGPSDPTLFVFQGV